MRGGPRARAAIEAFFIDKETMERASGEIFYYLRRATQERFENQGTATGGSWPDYTGEEAQYGAVKRKLLGSRYGNRKLRWLPGREILFPSVVAPDHEHHIAEVRGMKMIFGTSVPYARNQQEGIGRGPKWAGEGRIKQRKFLVLEAKDTAAIRRIMAKETGI